MYSKHFLKNHKFSEKKKLKVHVFRKVFRGEAERFMLTYYMLV